MNARILRRAAVGIGALGLLSLPALLSAAEPSATEFAPAVPPAAMISDVALAANGTLRGQVVDATGTVMAGVTVAVRQQENAVAEATTDSAGKFEIAKLPGGVFQIKTDQSEGSFRLWAPKTAPPGARSSVLVVYGQTTVRGQSALGRLFSRPLTVAALAVTAVAVPVAVHQIEIDRASGS